MTSDQQASRASRWAVLFSALFLLGVWAAMNLPRLASGQSGVISFVLGSLFGTLLVLRAKTEGDEAFGLSGWALGAVAVMGVVAVVIGLVVPIHQLDWLGVLMVLYAALAWSLPRRYGRDLLLALFIIYWVHPLPSQVFGPLQLGMQWLSVKLSEALLHIFNVGVWGDGLVLRTGLRVFGVPESCSGMKTAGTVLFCGMGIGLLMRFPWFVTGGLLVVGMLQVLILNVIRISGIVWLGKDRPPEWNERVLHDTMGIFLILAVGLIHLNAVLIRQSLRRRKRQENIYKSGDDIGEPEEKLKRWPEFWRLVFHWWKPVLGLLILMVGGSVLIHRLLPSHRAELLRGVAEGMMVSDLPNAERTVRAALEMAPDHAGLKYDLALILLNRGRREEALEQLRRKPAAAITLQDMVLEARTLLELKRMGDVGEVIKRFPADSLEYPGVAMILSEFNAIMDRPSDVARHVVKAARGLGTQERIRRLFPYMASRNLWDSVRESDSETPYSLPLYGVIAAEAHLRANDVAGAANVLRRAMKGDELDPVFMGPLIRVAKELPESEWIGRFEAVFKANIGKLKASELAMAMEGGFALGRPDLGWLAYCRMSVVEPDDPTLMIIPAEHGRKWFGFRHEALGMTKSGLDPLVDVRSFYLATRGFSPWKELWSRIPLAGELGSVVTREGYRKRLIMCLDSLERVEKTDKLDGRLQVLYAQVLGELGRWDEAHAKLKGFERANPQRSRDLLLAHAALYKAQGEVELSFEALAEYIRGEGHPSLTVYLDQANAAMSLEIGPYAMGIMEEARRDFPESGEWALAMAGLWNYFGFPEESLFLINGLSVPPPAVVKALLLMATGRVVDGQRVVVVENLTDITPPKKQTQLLAPAEWTVEWRGDVLREADYAREAAALPVWKTPFLKKFRKLRSDWYAARGGQGSSDVALWEDVGRDKREKAMALNELTVLLMRQGRQQEAMVPARRSLELMPAWSLLWRLNVILSNDFKIAEAAYKACPRDSEIWLAHLVRGVQNGQSAAWAGQVVDRAIRTRQVSPATLVRAGDFLVRKEMTQAACQAARAAIKEGQGLLPAYVLGIQCAIKTKDMGWAITSARVGAEQALEPWPFYKLIVGLKTKGGSKDPDVVRALEGLAAEYPTENIWSERLGEVYFLQGQTERAMGVLQDAIAREQGQKKASARTYMLAAESARCEGDPGKAISILRLARNRYPDDINVLNNLAYSLAQAPESIGQAVALVPDLLGKGGEDFAILDTVAMIYLRSGDFKAAEVYMKKAITRVKKGDYAWIEVYLNAAETQIKLGKFKEARESLSLVMKTPERSPVMDARARELQGELTLREREKQGWF